MSTEISWLPHSQSIKDCLYLIKFVLRCLYIEDDNRFMFLTEIKNVGKPDVEIDEKIFGTGSGTRTGSASSYTEKHLIEKNIYMKIDWYL